MILGLFGISSFRSTAVTVATIALSTGLWARLETKPVQPSSAVEISGDESELAAAIDEFAGHPDDPALPSTTVGASDEALADTDSRTIANLLNETRAFAESHPETPRFLFALGRAALAHGYTRLGQELLTKAAAKGSVPARAYLGFQAESDGKVELALAHLKAAERAGFKPQAVLDSLAELEGAKATSEKEDSELTLDIPSFNQRMWIGALYRGELKSFQQVDNTCLVYALTLHSTLANENIVFIVRNSRILLELHPAACVEAERRLAELKAVTKGSPSNITDLLKVQAIQDARRLAMAYDVAPGEFRKVYRNLSLLVRSR